MENHSRDTPPATMPPNCLDGLTITIETLYDDVAVVVNMPGRATERVGEITRVLDAIGARVWLIGQAVDGLVRQPTVFPLADVPEMISPLLAVVPVQLLAYHMAVVKDINPDLFRRDEDRYAAAFKLLTL